jgi:hypothetical protein
LPTTTIILPINREQHLLKVFASLELLECDRESTSLLAFVDGEADLFSTARNLVEQSKVCQAHLRPTRHPRSAQGVQHQHAPAPDRGDPQRNGEADYAKRRAFVPDRRRHDPRSRHSEQAVV